MISFHQKIPYGWESIVGDRTKFLRELLPEWEWNPIEMTLTSPNRKIKIHAHFTEISEDLTPHKQEIMKAMTDIREKAFQRIPAGYFLEETALPMFKELAKPYADILNEYGRISAHSEDEPVAERLKAKAEIMEYCRKVLDEYCRALPFKVAPPEVKWTLDFPPYYNPLNRTIYICEHINVPGWIAFRDLTKKSLRCTLAHEFWHYIQDIKPPLGIRILDFTRIAEWSARRNAEKLSGMSSRKCAELTGELLTKIMTRWRIT